MQVEISPETADKLHKLVATGLYDSVEAAIREAVALIADSDEIYEAELDARLEASRTSVREGRHRLLTMDLVEEIKREGRARLRHGEPRS